MLFVLGYFSGHLFLKLGLERDSDKNDILSYINISLQMCCYSVNSPNFTETFNIIEFKK